MLDFTDGYTKRFALRIPVQGAKYLEVGIPWIVVEREARKHNMKTEEFIKVYEAECVFNNFEGVHYQFVPKEVVNEPNQGNK